MKATLEEALEVLEPELRGICGGLNAAQRMDLAEKFLRWTDQLTYSVGIADPKLLRVLPPPRVPRGFFLVNLDAWSQTELRRMARACGFSLRGMVNWAVTRVGVELREKIRVAKLLGINPKAAWQFGVADGRN